MNTNCLSKRVLGRFALAERGACRTPKEAETLKCARASANLSVIQFNSKTQGGGAGQRRGGQAGKRYRHTSCMTSCKEFITISCRYKRWAGQRARRLAGQCTATRSATPVMRNVFRGRSGHLHMMLVGTLRCEQASVEVPACFTHRPISIGLYSMCASAAGVGMWEYYFYFLTPSSLID